MTGLGSSWPGLSRPSTSFLGRIAKAWMRGTSPRMTRGGVCNTVLFPPPAAAVSLYRGEVMHARLKPVGHRFVYMVFNILIDLDRLEAADRASALFSIDRFNLASFCERDHGPGDGSSLRAHIAGLLKPCGIDLAGGRVLLLCYPRLFGYAFNPLSVYYAYDRDGDLAAVVYEVRNTFGERHTYVAPVEPGSLTEAGLRQERDKLFYVSPFMGMGMRYRFRLRPPTETVTVRIIETDTTGPILAATFAATRRTLTTASLVAACAALPFMALKVIAGIHWEALKLWGKGLHLHPRPRPPQPVSYVRHTLAPGTRIPSLRNAAE
jgi:DUF1365 family protein